MKSNAHSILDPVLTIFSLVGAALNSCGSVLGFVIWIPCNIGLYIINCRRGYKWQAALFAAYTITAAWGIYEWFKK